jgi:hypothetical protein
VVDSDNRDIAADDGLSPPEEKQVRTKTFVGEHSFL